MDDPSATADGTDLIDTVNRRVQSVGSVLCYLDTEFPKSNPQVCGVPAAVALRILSRLQTFESRS